VRVFFTFAFFPLKKAFGQLALVFLFRQKKNGILDVDNDFFLFKKPLFT